MKNFWRIFGILAFLALSYQVITYLNRDNNGIVALPGYSQAVVLCGECAGSGDKVEEITNLWGTPVATLECFGGHMMTINPTHYEDPQVDQLRDLSLDKCPPHAVIGGSR